MEYKINIKTNSSGIKIYINDLLHLEIKDINDYVGIQSWKNGSDNYIIEYYIKGINPIKCAYNDFNKWKQILEGLDKIS